MKLEVRQLCAATLWGMCLTLPSIAAAVEIEISPVAGFRFGGEFEEETTGQDVDLKEAAAFGLAIDIEYAPDRMVEIFYSRQSSEIEDIAPALDVDVEYFQIGGVAEFPQENYTPYAVGTIGATRFSPDGDLDEETQFSFTMGGGVKWAFAENWAVKVEGRAYLTFFDSRAEVFCVSSGGATCLFRTTSSVVWQLEALAGVAFRF